MHMNKQVFYDTNLFPIDISAYIKDNDIRYLLYSPLAKSFVLAGEKDMDVLTEELTVNGRFNDPELQNQLIDTIPQIKNNYAQSPHEVFALTILPNNICNFSCSYCYAAKGHSNDIIDEGKLQAVLDFFIDPDRISRRDIYISFGGGGEPFISWATMKFAIEYASHLADKYGFKVNFSFASNGSIISKEIVEILKQYKVKANISFDILEEIQNLQRKNYAVVCKTLDLLLDNDIYPTINSVITPANVALQEQMVEHIHNRFPRLRRLSFDSVVDSNLFDNPQQLKDFYDEYIKHFFTARLTGHKYDITVSCIKHHNLELIKSRACAGGFDLTPTGKLSMCFFVSSSKEPLYDDFIYGEVNEDNRLVFDNEKFSSLINYKADRNQHCQTCFIKWHCGGGCLYHAKTYNTQMLDVMCDFQRKFSTIALLENVMDDNEFKECIR